MTRTHGGISDVKPLQQVVALAARSAMRFRPTGDVRELLLPRLPEIDGGAKAAVIVLPKSAFR
jgi:hypothetical protein